MEAVYVPTRNNKTGTDLKENAAKYFTNGRYNPMRSAVIAEEYKEKREKMLKKRRDALEINSLFATNIFNGLKTNLRY